MNILMWGALLTRTFRAYNKNPIIGGPGFKGWIRSQKLTWQDVQGPVQYEWQRMIGPYIGYDPYRQWGRMRFWKDWRLDSRRRQARKYEVQREFKEFAPHGLFFGDSPYDFTDRDEVYSLLRDPLEDLVDVWYDYEDFIDRAGKYEPDYYDF